MASMRTDVSRALFALTALLFACRPEQPATPAAPSKPVQAAPHTGGQLTRRLESDVNTLNYVLQTTDYERNVLAYLYEPIVDLDADLRPIPGAASKWEISPDQKTYTLYLNPAATFSDGT